MNSSKLCVLFFSLFLAACSSSPEKTKGVDSKGDIINGKVDGKKFKTNELLTLSPEELYTEGNISIEKITYKQAQSSYQNREYSKALEEYRSLYAKNKEDINLLFKIGNTYSRLGNNDQAIKTYKKVIAMDQSHSKAWYNLGVIYMKESAGTWEKMREHIEQSDPLYKRAKYFGDGMLGLINQKN